MTILLYVLNVLFASGQSAFSKLYAAKDGKSAAFNLNKAAAGFAVFLLFGAVSGLSFHLPTVLSGVGYGIFLCVSMYTGFKALSSGPMALTSIVASFSLLLPFFFGICFWNEPLTAFGAAGIALLLPAIVLINGKKAESVNVTWALYACATLVANGICSIIQKHHQMQFPAQYRTEFMLCALLSVTLLLIGARVAKPVPGEKFTFSALGMVSGIFNSAANYIVLYLSATENASVLFPIVSVANIAAVWVIGIVFFHEKLTLRQTVGLLLGVLSVVLLKL